jgi:hypothetical protein
VVIFLSGNAPNPDLLKFPENILDKTLVESENPEHGKIIFSIWDHGQR